jgi:hypothetical protein
MISLTCLACFQEFSLDPTSGCVQVSCPHCGAEVSLVPQQQVAEAGEEIKQIEVDVRDQVLKRVTDLEREEKWLPGLGPGQAGGSGSPASNHGVDPSFGAEGGAGSD